MTSPNITSRSDSYPRTTELLLQQVQQPTLKKKYELSEIEQAALRALNMRLMSLAHLKSYAGACQASDSYKEEQETFFKIVKRSKYFEHEKIGAANAISILNQIGYSFSRQKLKKVRIPGAYLEGANLFGADLRKADLTGVSLINAELSCAQFKGAKMEDIKLGQAPMIKCNSPVSALCVDQKEDRLFAAVGKTIMIWDLRSGKELTLEGHTKDVTTIELFPNEQRLASGGFNRAIYIWDLKKRAHTKLKYPDKTSRTTALTVHPDGLRVISASTDQKVRIWNVASRQVIGTLDGVEYKGTTSYVPPYITSLTFFPDRKRLMAAGSVDLEMRFWNLENGIPISFPYENIASVLFIPDQDQVLLGESPFGKISLCDLRIEVSQKTIRTYEGHRGTVSALALFPDKQRFIAASKDSTIRIWHLTERTELRRFVGHQSAVNSLVLTSQGKSCISGGEDKSIRFWNLNQVEVDSTERTKSLASISDIVLIPGKKQMLVISDDYIKLWDCEKRVVVKELTTKWCPKNLALFPDETNFIFTSDDVRLWNMESGEQEIYADRIGCTALVIIDQLEWVVGDIDGNLWIFHLGQKDFIKSFLGHKGGISRLAVDPQRKLLISAGERDGKILLWDLKKGGQFDKPNVVYKHSPFMGCLFQNGGILQSGGIAELQLFSRSRRIVFTERSLVDSDLYFHYFDLDKKDEIKKFKTGLYQGPFALFSDEKKLIVQQITAPGCLGLLDLDSQKITAEIPHYFPITTIVLQDDRYLYTGDNKGGLYLWELQKIENDQIQMKLLWVSQPIFASQRTKIKDTPTLSFENRRFMEQNGAFSE